MADFMPAFQNLKSLAFQHGMQGVVRDLFRAPDESAFIDYCRQLFQSLSHQLSTTGDNDTAAEFVQRCAEAAQEDKNLAQIAQQILQGLQVQDMRARREAISFCLEHSAMQAYLAKNLRAILLPKYLTREEQINTVAESATKEALYDWKITGQQGAYDPEGRIVRDLFRLFFLLLEMCLVKPTLRSSSPKIQPEENEPERIYLPSAR